MMEMGTLQDLFREEESNSFELINNGLETERPYREHRSQQLRGTWWAGCVCVPSMKKLRVGKSGR